MIKKLDIMKDTRNIIDKGGIVHTVVNLTAIEKINELADAVNDIIDWIKRTDETIVKYGIKPIPEKIAQGFKNLQDPYAEQRRWIGKLCKFSNDDGFDEVGYLTEIDPDMPEAKYRCNCHDYYEKCEPVKPDDEIIYKGGNNE